MSNSDWSRQSSKPDTIEEGSEVWRSNPIISRLDRWADRLPATECIPVGQDEVYELCLLMSGKASKYTVAGKSMGLMTELEILESLRSGNFHYREHKLVVV